MERRNVTRSRTLSLAGAAALLMAIAAPSGAGQIYSWRTEDGGYAFTDDPKAIPARYRDQAKVRASARLGDYARYTPSDDRAAERYAERLTQRLAHLRAVNAQPVVRRDAVARSGFGPTATLTLNSANEYAPSVEISEATGGEPIIVETLFTRPEGKIVTRHSQVVRQGDQILSVMKPRLREWNVVTDIHDEADLTD